VLLAATSKELERLQKQMKIEELGAYVAKGADVLSGVRRASALPLPLAPSVGEADDAELNWCQQYLSQENNNPQLRTRVDRAMGVAAEVKQQLEAMDRER
jgi:hypothetical protein